uniref:Uncharacterized protein n=1 Tax=viral metagenome TaxID=1070528 RepID=A0A6C0BM60_9ZZZZ
MSSNFKVKLGEINVPAPPLVKKKRGKIVSIPSPSYTTRSGARRDSLDITELLKVSDISPVTPNAKVTKAPGVIKGRGMKRNSGLENNGLTPASKRPKGLRGVLKSRDTLSDPTVSDFQTPEPMVLNDYWVYFAVPQKALFRNLLNLEPLEPVPVLSSPVPPRPEVSAAQLEASRSFDLAYEELQKEKMRLLHSISVLEREPSTPHIQTEISETQDRVEELCSRMVHMERDNQMVAFEHARQVCQWYREKEQLEAPRKSHLKQENERKANVFMHVQKGLMAHQKHINNVQKAVFEVELSKSTDLFPGGAIPEITDDMPAEQVGYIQSVKDRVDRVLDKVEVSSRVKADLCSQQSVIKRLVPALRAHVPPTKGKYEKSGQFTKEKRAKKVATARMYRKTGKHINDYQNPRDRKQRDAQIEKRAKALGVSPAKFRQAVIAKRK